MKHHIDQLREILNEYLECIVSFDIWGTLLDLDKLLETVAFTISRKPL